MLKLKYHQKWLEYINLWKIYNYLIFNVVDNYVQLLPNEKF